MGYSFHNNDKELFKACRELLFPAVVGDILDEFGEYNQFLPAGIKPLDPKAVLVGRAMTVHEENGRDLENPFGLMFKALDDLKEGEIYICDDNTSDFAQWGGLMSTRAQHLGAAGAILGGYSRDTKEILSINFPVFSIGTYSKDQKVRGCVTEFRKPIRFNNGVIVESGDLLFGDRDGVVVIPRRIEEKVIAKALEKAASENKVRKAIIEGISAEKAFNEYGVM